METHKHQIRTQCLELSFESERSASQWQQRVIDISQRELQQAIEKCLDLFCPSHQFIRFQKLEIDIGSIAIEEVASEWPTKVAEALRVALGDALFHPAASGAEIKSLAITQIDSIAHYLGFGFLPWNQQSSDVSSLFKNTLIQEPMALSKLLRTLGVSASVRTRLVERLGNDQLRELVKLLEPHHANDLIAYHAYLVQINRKEEIVETQQHVLEKTLWLFVFNFLLVERDSAFNAKSYTRSILQQFAFHFNIAYGYLVDLVVVGLHQWKGELPAPLWSALLELQTERMNGNADGTDSSTTKKEDQSLALPFELWLQKTTTDWKTDDATLIQLVNELTKNKHKKIALEQLLAKSHESIPVQIVRYLVPAEANAIEAYHLYVISVHRQQPIAHVSEREAKNTLWTLIIIHLLDNQGSYFNQKIFLRSLILRTAAHYNLSEFVLLEKLVTSRSEWKALPSTLQHFLQIVNEIYEETNKEKKGAAKPAGKDNISKNILLKLEDAWKKSERLDANNAEAVSFWISQSLRASHIPLAALIRKYMHKEQVREQIASLAQHEFNQIITLTVKSPMAGIIQRGISFLEKCKLELLPYFGSEVTFQYTIHKAAIDVALVLKGNRNESDVIRLIFEKFAFGHNGLSTEQLLQLYNSVQPKQLAPKNIRTSLVPAQSKSLEQKYNPNVDMLLQMVTEEFSLNNWTDWGFASREEAIQFLIRHYPMKLRENLAHVRPQRLQSFLSSQSASTINTLMDMNSSGRTKQYQTLLAEWGRNLEKIQPGKRWLEEVQKVWLMADITGKSINSPYVLQALIRLINRFRIPDLFFERIARWTLPASGDLTDAIRYIEKSVLHNGGQSTEVLSRKSKLRILHESVEKIKRTEASKQAFESTNEKEPLFLANAGLVLVHPYFSFLFEQCGLLNGQEFKSQHGQSTAVALLHYAVSGKEDYREEDSILYKLLCGLPLHEVTRVSKLKKKEKKLVNDMLHALTTHWSVINNSTADEVRGNWFIREGRLVEHEEHWELTIGRKPYDILLNSLPYTLSPVKFIWMPKRLSIHWI